MGGKSRKSGGVSKLLIQKIKMGVYDPPAKKNVGKKEKNEKSIDKRETGFFPE